MHTAVEQRDANEAVAFRPSVDLEYSCSRINAREFRVTGLTRLTRRVHVDRIIDRYRDIASTSHRIW